MSLATTIPALIIFAILAVQIQFGSRDVKMDVLFKRAIRLRSNLRSNKTHRANHSVPKLGKLNQSNLAGHYWLKASTTGNNFHNNWRIHHDDKHYMFTDMFQYPGKDLASYSLYYDLHWDETEASNMYEDTKLCWSAAGILLSLSSTCICVSPWVQLEFNLAIFNIFVNPLCNCLPAWCSPGSLPSGHDSDSPRNRDGKHFWHNVVRSLMSLAYLWVGCLKRGVCQWLNSREAKITETSSFSFCGNEGWDYPVVICRL